MNIKIAHRLINVSGLGYYLKANQALNFKTKITIVTYHSVSPNSYKYAITPKTFNRQMEFIKENYQIIRLNQIADAFNHCRKEVRKLIITFDDAFASFYQFAYPTLRRLSIPCTIFIPSALIGRYNVWDSHKGLLPKIQIMDKQELLTLSREGLVDFGSHTINHVSMRNLAPDEMRRQAVDSKKELETLFGLPITMFAYPYGQLGDMSKLTTRILSEAGYEIAVTTRWGTLQTSRKILELKRIFFDEQDSHADLSAKIEGSYDWLALKERMGFLLRSGKCRFFLLSNKS